MTFQCQFQILQKTKNHTLEICVRFEISLAKLRIRLTFQKDQKSAEINFRFDTILSRLLVDWRMTAACLCGEFVFESVVWNGRGVPELKPPPKFILANQNGISKGDNAHFKCCWMATAVLLGSFWTRRKQSGRICDVTLWRRFSFGCTRTWTIHQRNINGLVREVRVKVGEKLVLVIWW